MRDKRKRKMATVRLPRWVIWLILALASALAVAIAFFGLHWLSVLVGQLEIDDADLGSVLEAQAAMTAIFLAAMIFIVEAVQRREGLDDPLYELFLNKSRARWIFATAVWLLIGTALLYVFGPFTMLFSELADARADVIGIGSLVLAALLILAFLLRALDVLRPEEYRKLRRDAVLDQVRIGVRSQAQAQARDPRSKDGISDTPETQAARTIERVVDHAHQAAEQAQLTDIRENMEIFENICRDVADELEKDERGMPAIGTLDEQQWLGYDNILSGIQRLVHVANIGTAFEYTLPAIFYSSVMREATSHEVLYRLSANVESGNELFVQVMIECIKQEKDAVNRLPNIPLANSSQEPRTEMLKDALQIALSKSNIVDGRAHRHRIAIRVVKVIHEFAASAAIQQDAGQAFDLLKSCLQNADDIFSTVGDGFTDDCPLCSVLRQAVLSAIGYAVARKNHNFLDIAASSAVVSGLLDARRPHYLYEVLERDFAQQHDRESVLGRGLFWLTTSMGSSRKKLKTESERRRTYTEGVILGYMWLLGMIHRGTEEVILPSKIENEYDRVWHEYRVPLVAALNHAGVGGDLWSWGEAAFSVSRG